MLKSIPFKYSKGTKKAIVEYSTNKDDFDNTENMYCWDIKIQTTTLHMFITLDENDNAVDAGFLREIFKAICKTNNKELYVRVQWNAE